MNVSSEARTAGWRRLLLRQSQERLSKRVFTAQLGVFFAEQLAGSPFSKDAFA